MILLALLQLTLTGTVNLPAASPPMDVPAIAYTIDAPYPCNIRPHSNGFPVTASCITGPETHYRCLDTRRVLLTSEDGVHHCILFPRQEPESVTIFASPASK
jgi:hypothetical protein